MTGCYFFDAEYHGQRAAGGQRTARHHNMGLYSSSRRAVILLRRSAGDECMNLNIYLLSLPLPSCPMSSKALPQRLRLSGHRETPSAGSPNVVYLVRMRFLAWQGRVLRETCQARTEQNNRGMPSQHVKARDDMVSGEASGSGRQGELNQASKAGRHRER